MWVRELSWIEPAEAAARLAHLPCLAFLDSAKDHPALGRYSYVAADPFGTFRVRAGRAFWNDVVEPLPPIAALRQRLANYKADRNPDLPPFQGGAIGFFGYEFGWSLEGRVAPVGNPGDDACFGFYDIVLAFDHAARRAWLIATGAPDMRGAGVETRLAEIERALSQPAPRVAGAPPSIAWRADQTPADFRAGVERIKSYIRAGDIYQANLAQRFTASLPADLDPFALYRLLRTANPAPFAAYLDCGASQILSTSPELFLRCDGTRVETRPIKGTARRGADDRADRLAAAQLCESVKDRAENVMIVDLLRNDLARVCVPDTIEVPILCGLETYAGLHHLVSVVTGQLDVGLDVLDLVAASFPGGSITGAPKIRAMEIIAEIEGRPRGVYCGAIGAIGFDGSIDLNIAIRTILLAGRRLELCAGGGITMLSDPQAEYEETLVKARRIFDAFAPTHHLVDA